ncbi:PREDICTED: uncharacterized protein LOC106728120 [Myotis brandtii]|uniref:uncharacterized protein LOC106728120 n=1 Tax=Myotis brandtii TaxID=109478 RepID=UPI0007040E72|nr:PREDICTED: uncharacterized protein LOC106728120 [Myotis brandtii]
MGAAPPMPGPGSCGLGLEAMEPGGSPGDRWQGARAAPTGSAVRRRGRDSLGIAVPLVLWLGEETRLCVRLGDQLQGHRELTEVHALTTRVLHMGKQARCRAVNSPGTQLLCCPAPPACPQASLFSVWRKLLDQLSGDPCVPTQTPETPRVRATAAGAPRVARTTRLQNLDASREQRLSWTTGAWVGVGQRTGPLRGLEKQLFLEE